ncbi:MAG: HisS family protein [archaeon]
MKTNTVKGFRDFVGVEAMKRAKILKIIREQFELYGFEPTETPTVEYEEFVRGENENDEAVSEIFKLEDRGQRELALKYESTFQLKRIAQNQKLPYKRYEICRVFRDEPVSANRFREFVQCDVDVVGSSMKDEVEVLSLAKRILDKVGIDCVIYFNNRKLLNEILVSENVAERDRERVIRELDKFDKLSRKEVADNLKKIGAEKILKVFEKGDFGKYKFYEEIKVMKKACRAYGLKLEFLPTLARGLSYYNGTIFEIRSGEMKDSICGGGAYLIDDVQSFGFAFGLERIVSLSDVEGDVTKVQIISIDEDDAVIDLAGKLRDAGISVNVLMDKSVGKALEYANAKRIGKVVIVGKDEVAKGKFKVKDMESGEEEFLKENEIIEMIS